MKLIELTFEETLASPSGKGVFNADRIDLLLPRQATNGYPAHTVVCTNSDSDGRLYHYVKETIEEIAMLSGVTIKRLGK